MERIIKHIHRHGKMLHSHMTKHHKRYILWGFGVYVVIKAMILILWIFGGYGMVSMADYTDTVGDKCVWAECKNISFDQTKNFDINDYLSLFFGKKSKSLVTDQKLKDMEDFLFGDKKQKNEIEKTAKDFVKIYDKLDMSKNNKLIKDSMVMKDLFLEWKGKSNKIRVEIFKKTKIKK